jgi:transcriptional regulator with XRE-family HTH domain
MHDISEIADIIALARTAAGLSQAELASRSGTTQSAIARLEKGESNPTLATLARTAAAAGYAIAIELTPLPHTDPVIARYKRDVDRTLLRANLRRSVDERLRSLASWQVSLRSLAQATSSAKRQQ